MAGMTKERIVVVEDGADLLRDAVVREACVALELGEQRRMAAWRRVQDAIRAVEELFAPEDN